MPFITVKEASRLLTIGKSTLYRLSAAKSIPHYRVGGRLVFSENELLAFMEDHSVGLGRELEREAGSKTSPT